MASAQITSQVPLAAKSFLTSTVATAATLYVASYSGGTWAGNITSLSLLQNPDLTYSLTQTHTLNSSTNSPSWLTLNRFNNVLYLVDEAINSTTNGNLVAYKTHYTGGLTEVSRIETEVGGVHGVFFASGQALAIPHYTGGLLRTYRLYASGKEIKPIETFNFSTPDFKIGPVADRQEAPHPHQTILDPTQQFILVPDLGADLVHVFFVDQKTMKLRQQAPLKTPAGYGPRHAVFSVDKISGNYVFYLVGELVGLVTAYSVSYAKNGLTFHKIASYSTLDPGQHFPFNPDGSSKVAPAAIDITPDGSMLTISNRNDTTFGISPPTDSLATFSISRSDGTLTKFPLVSAHGSFPRQFALNKAGTLLAMGLQQSGSLVVLGRNKISGLFDQEVASIKFEQGADMPVCVVWDE